MESEKNGVKTWLKARTLGLCSALNRQMDFHTVRSTKPVAKIQQAFVNDPAYSTPRSDQHLAKHPNYPDSLFYLQSLGKYYVRGAELLHLRIEQFNRYCCLLDDKDGDERKNITMENTRDADEDVRYAERSHRHYDAFMESEPVGKQARKQTI